VIPQVPFDPNLIDRWIVWRELAGHGRVPVAVRPMRLGRVR
jgi:hypothetical protein